ncbi:hypothetical protein [Pseudoalteromonas denitrificans]|uniref:Uncharacterized protein n=1 Tax=Pseudoalteromonas denitrificans DSM 6059 TaxID=1123010 RepID=A0A1I1SK92_9GAMM|nr:hypothetical protein [Pseudoalteromonas denitrificans]SFD46894.1 hypothetical protein SAMN02745724_04609 [Pseudoalteromonas denitrificans DSM 6059]
MTDLEFNDINNIAKKLIDNKSPSTHFEQYNNMFKDMFAKAQHDTDYAMSEIARLNKLRT